MREPHAQLGGQVRRKDFVVGIYQTCGGMLQGGQQRGRSWGLGMTTTRHPLGSGNACCRRQIAWARQATASSRAGSSSLKQRCACSQVPPPPPPTKNRMKLRQDTSAEMRGPFASFPRLITEYMHHEGQAWPRWLSNLLCPPRSPPDAPSSFIVDGRVDSITGKHPSPSQLKSQALLDSTFSLFICLGKTITVLHESSVSFEVAEWLLCAL